MISSCPTCQTKTRQIDASIYAGDYSSPASTRNLFLRSDYAGRYSRFLFCRNVLVPDDIVRIIEAIIYPHKMESCQTGFGFLTLPHNAKRMKDESERLDLKIAKQQAIATKEDLEKAR